MALEIEYGRQEWRTDPKAADAEARRRVALARDAADPADRETVFLSDLGALTAIPSGLGEIRGLRRLIVGTAEGRDGTHHDPFEWEHHLDLAALVEADKLVEINFGGRPVADISPLAGLSHLQKLDLAGTQVADIAPLAWLSSLHTLDLVETQVTDLSPLAGLSDLHTLALHNTEVADISPLAGLSHLRTLELSDTRVADISPLAGLSQLQTLDLRVTQVANTGPLAGLSGLQDLSLGATEIADIAPLARLSNLEALDLSGTLVADISPLTGLSHLHTLDLDDTHVSDLSPLAEADRLEVLSFRHTAAAASDGRMVLLSNLPGRECARQTRLYLNGEHPDFRPPEHIRTRRHAAAALAAAARQRPILTEDGRIGLADKGAERPARPNPELLAQELTAQAERVRIAADAAGRAQLDRDALDLLDSYARAVRVPRPTFAEMNAPGAPLCALIRDPDFRRELPPRSVVLRTTLDELADAHDRLRALMIPPEDVLAAELEPDPPLRDEIDAEAAEADIAEAREVLESETGRSAAEDEFRRMVEYAEREVRTGRRRGDRRRIEGGVRRATTIISLLSNAATLAQFAGIPNLVKLVGMLRRALNALLDLFREED